VAKNTRRAAICQNTTSCRFYDKSSFVPQEKIIGTSTEFRRPSGDKFAFRRAIPDDRLRRS
jgi:hypothetical protein